MVEYTEEDLKDLISFIDSFTVCKESNLSQKNSTRELFGVYENLADLLQKHLDCGSFKFNVREGGSAGAASFIVELQQLYPDVYRALFQLSREELLLYLNETHEGLIAQWRYDRGL